MWIFQKKRQENGKMKGCMEEGMNLPLLGKEEGKSEME